MGAENIYVEYLDTKRFYWEDYLQQLAQVLRRKYRDFRPDLVLVTDNNAFDFMRRYGDGLFPGIPVVFCGVNNLVDGDLKGHPNFTGVSEEADLRGSLDVALSLVPGTRCVYSIHDSTETGRIVAERFRALFPSYPAIRFVPLEGMDLKDILARLHNLPPHTIVFHPFFGRDASGQSWPYEQSMALVAENAKVPVFSAWDFNLGHGAVGGVLTRGADQGAAAARIALRILSGERPQDIPVVRDLPGRLMFDGRELERFRIPLQALPKSSEIINQPESAFSRYRTLLITLTGTVALLVTIIAILSANISRRKQAEDDLIRYQAHLEDLVQERSSQLQTANEELQRDLVARERAESALRRAEANLRNIFDHAAEGIYQASPGGHFLAVNPALARMAGYATPAEMVRVVEDLRTDFFVDRVQRLDFERRLAEETELRAQESMIRRRDGQMLWILESARVKRRPDGSLEHFEGFIQDISERRRDEEALRNSQQLLDSTFASLLDALFIINAGSRTVRDCNPATRQLFGYTREELIGASARILHVDEASYQILEVRALEAFATHGFLNLPNFQMRRKGGEVFVCELALMPLRDQVGTLTSWVCVVRDITEQRQMEAKLDLTRRKLRALTAELSAVEERERRAIATQLHDELGAVLAMVKVKLATLLREAEGAPMAAALETIHGLVGEAVSATRSLTWELSPPVLYQLGLGAAIEWLCEACEEKNGLAIAFTQLGEPAGINEEMRFLLFSAVRELLLNIVKHAEASQVTVTLAWTEGRVLCCVEDNGKGFVLSEVGTLREAHRSFGLFNIQERVADLDGRVDIVSVPGQGTTVTLVLPFGEEGHA
nr:ABC transporter substrate binding protein [uncultured Holophaga sp.]